MAVKHQSESYRNINGYQYTNYADLVLSDEENKRIVDEAKAKFNSVRKIKIKYNGGYFYRLFVTNIS